jgi:hypothetical protein
VSVSVSVSESESESVSVSECAYVAFVVLRVACECTSDVGELAV